MEYLSLAVNIAPAIVMVASAIAVVTPTPIDNKALVWVKRILNVLALNIGAAKNAQDVIAEQSRGLK